MNAQELTKYILDKINPEIKDLNERVYFLEQENTKLRRITNDQKYDIKDLQDQIRRMKYDARVRRRTGNV